MNPEDPLEQHEDQDDDKYKEETFEEYDFSSDPDKPFISEERFQKIVSLLKSKKNIILEGAPGVGKTFLARKVAYQLIGAVKTRI